MRRTFIALAALILISCAVSGCANRTRLAATEPETVEEAVGALSQLITLHGVAAKADTVNNAEMVWLMQMHDHDNKLEWVQRRMRFNNVRTISLPIDETLGWKVEVETTIGRYNFHFDKTNPKFAAEFRAALSKLVRSAGGVAAYPDA